MRSLEKTDGSDKDKMSVSKRKSEIADEIETFLERQRDIESTYVKGDMGEYLEELRSKRKAPSREPLSFEEEPEEHKTDDASDIMSMISSINIEISDLETELVKAQIDGDKNKCDKVEMLLSSLKSRRYDLIEMMKSEKSDDVETSNEEIDEMKKDIASLRTQLGNLRGDVFDVKDMVLRVIDHLGIDRDR